jgi:hypothetical protein
MRTTDDIDLRRYLPTLDDLAAGFAIAGRDIAPALQQAEGQYGPTPLISAFVMLGDIFRRPYGDNPSEPVATK